jgi:hypothetical protein
MAIWQCAGPVDIALAPGMRKHSIQLSNVPAARPALRKEEPGIDCAVVGNHNTGKRQRTKPLTWTHPGLQGARKNFRCAIALPGLTLAIWLLISSRTLL